MQPKSINSMPQQSSNSGSSETITNNTSLSADSKKGKYLSIIIVLVVIAVAGLGFGVYELWQNIQKDEKIAELEADVSQKDTKLTELGNQITDLKAQVQELKSKTATMADDDQTDTEDAIIPVLIGHPKFEVTDNIFYVKNQDGEVMAFSDGANIKEIVSCDTGTAKAWETYRTAKCIIVTVDGEKGWFVYKADDNSLQFGTYNF